MRFIIHETVIYGNYRKCFRFVLLDMIRIRACPDRHSIGLRINFVRFETFFFFFLVSHFNDKTFPPIYCPTPILREGGFILCLNVLNLFANSTEHPCCRTILLKNRFMTICLKHHLKSTFSHFIFPFNIIHILKFTIKNYQILKGLKLNKKRKKRLIL